MERKNLLIFILICILANSLNGQNSTPPGSYVSLFDSIVLNRIHYFKFEYTKTIDSLFIDYKDSFKFTTHDKMYKIYSKPDDYGFTYHRFKQYYKGFPVDQSDIIVVTSSGKKTVMYGKIISMNTLDTAGTLPASQAVTIAMNQFVENKAYSEEFIDISQPVSSSMVILTGDTPRLTYKVNLDVIDKSSRNMTITIDAHSGLVLRKANTSIHNSQGCTEHYGKKAINTVDSVSQSYFGCRIRGETSYFDRNLFIDTTRNIKFITYFYSVDNDTFTDVDGVIKRKNKVKNYVYNHDKTQINDIGCAGDNSTLKHGVEAHWLVGKFIDMVQVKYNTQLDSMKLNSMYICNHDPDVTNSRKNFLFVFVLDNSSFINNASYSGSSIRFGRRVNDYELEKKDRPVYMMDAEIVGHELGHFLLRNIGNFGSNYYNESGVIDEGLADVMGYLLEHYIFTSHNSGKPATWQTPDIVKGAPVYDGINHSAMWPHARNLKNPQEKNAPSYAGGPFWYNPSETCCNPTDRNDNCYVHQNSTIVGKWFQLLIEGGINRDAPYQYPITAMPLDSVAKLLFYTIKTSLTNDINLATLCKVTTDNCSKIFSSSVATTYKTAVERAWWSVGISSGNLVRTRQTITIPANSTLSQYKSTIMGYNNNNPWLVETSNKDFIINGRFDIDQGMEFNCKQCKFFFANNASIIMQPNAVGNFDSCHFSTKSDLNPFSCSTNHFLWQGIKMVPFNNNCTENDPINPKLIIKNSIIEFAQVAIHSGGKYICDHQPSAPIGERHYRNQYGGLIEIDKVKFINNAQDIKYSRGDFAGYNLTVTNSEFLYTDTTLVNKIGCIELNQRWNDSLRRRFNSLTNRSVTSKNVTPVLISNCNFSTELAYTFASRDIKAIEYNMLFASAAKDINLLEINNCNFRGFNVAVIGSGASLCRIQNSFFNDVVTGISISQNTRVEILNNEFRRNQYALNIRNSVLDDNMNNSMSTLIKLNKFYYIYNSNYTNRKEIYLSNTRNALIEENTVYARSHTGSPFEPAYVAFHVVGTDNSRIQGNYFGREVCEGIDASWNPVNNCLYFKHGVPMVWERHDNNSGFFVKNTISDWWTRGIHTRYHNRNVRIKCNDLYPTKAPDHTAIFIDSGELKDQGVYSPNYALSCSRDNGIYPAANRFLYRSGNQTIHNNCSYTGFAEHSSQAINVASKQIAIRPFNLPVGYAFNYFTQQKDGASTFSPKTSCYTSSSLLNIQNCLPGSDGYEIKPSTCDDNNVYLIREPEGGEGSGAPCERVNIWKQHRLSLLQQLTAEPVICGQAATQNRFEYLNATVQNYLDILDADNHVFYVLDTCEEVEQYEAEIDQTPIAWSRYHLTERYIQRGRLSEATSLLSRLKTEPPLEQSILCDKRLEFFNAEHPRYIDVLDLELRQAQRALQGDTTSLSIQEIDALYVIRNQSKGRAAVKAEKLLESYAHDMLYRTIPGFSVTSSSAAPAVDTGTLLPLTIYPNPNSGQFVVAFEYLNSYSQAEIKMFKLTQPSQVVFSRILTDYPSYIQEPVQLNQVEAGLYTVVLIINNQPIAGATVQISY